jgi:hypothetical protein
VNSSRARRARLGAVTARHVVASEGFTAFEDRERRLRMFLSAYGWSGDIATFIATVQQRVRASAEGIRRTAAAGDPAYRAMIANAVDRDLEQTAVEMPEILRPDHPAPSR